MKLKESIKELEGIAKDEGMRVVYRYDTKGPFGSERIQAITTAILMDIRNDRRLIEGRTMCARDDVYVRNKGRIIALNRALTSFFGKNRWRIVLNDRREKNNKN